MAALRSEWGKNFTTAQEKGVRQAAKVLVLGATLLPLLACGNFFQCENKPACPASGGSGGGGDTTAGDFAYVSYTTTAGSSVITGYNIAKGALTTINAVTLPFVPIAMVVNPANTRLYVASVPGIANPGIYEYAIGTDGTLSSANSGGALATDLVGAMAISPDGNYLYTVQSTGSIGLTMTQYTVKTSPDTLTSSGVLTLPPSLPCTLSASKPVLPLCSVTVSPEKDYVVASLGTSGDAVFGYSSSEGITNNGAFSQITAGTNSGDFSSVIDSADNLYLAQTSTMTVVGLASSGNTNRGTYTYPAGSIPRSVVVDSAATFVYTADVGLGKITGFATGTTTALTVLSGSPFAAPASVAALGVDNTDGYLVAVGYDANAGVQLYSVATTGVLTPVKSTGTSTATQYPVLVAMSH